MNNNSFEDFVSSLDTTADTNYSLWKVANATRKPRSYAPPLKVASRFIHNDEGKAAAFASHLESVFQPNDTDSDIQPVIHNNSGQPIKLTSPTEIYNVIRKLKPKKAPGLDLITSNNLVQCPKKVFVLLTYIYNASFRLQYFPNPWKTAKIILIPKTGKPAEETASHRPISLLSTLSKVFEKLIRSRLHKIVDELGIILQHQFGFRAKHSTIEQAHRITAIIRNALEAKEFCPATYLDVQQALDRVWIQGLLHKVSECLPTPYTKLLQSYLTSRKFEVHYGEAVSDIKPILAGVPEGSVLVHCRHPNH